MIPLATTTINVYRLSVADMDAEPYSGKVPTTRQQAASNVRAVIGSVNGNEITTGGEQTTMLAKLTCDPCSINHTDYVKDNTTQEVYQVVWSTLRVGLGLNHISAMLKSVEGLP